MAVHADRIFSICEDGKESSFTDTEWEKLVTIHRVSGTI
jgi:hypothetical protein